MPRFQLDIKISGLCALTLKDGSHGAEVDVLPVDGGPHTPRISLWLADEPAIGTRLLPGMDLVVGPGGEGIGVWKITNQCVEIKLDPDLGRECGHTRAPNEPETPTGTVSESVINWVPSAEDLGLTQGIRVPKAASDIPTGASARVVLPAGCLQSADVVVDDNGDYQLWEFGNGKKRALANAVRLRCFAIEAATMTPSGKDAGTQGITITGEANRVIQVNISNDVDEVPIDYYSGITSLHHNIHFAELSAGKEKVTPPKKTRSYTRTARPICNQMIYEYS